MDNRVSTGIPGFDEIVSGGFVNGSVNLLSGGAGTGKSIFSMQFLHNGAKMYGERGMYISTEESVADLQADVAAFGIDFNEVSDNVKFYYFPPYEINDFTKRLAEVLKTFRPKRIVLDSVSSLISALEDDFERRKEVFEIVKLLKEMNTTSLLVSENTNSKTDEVFSRFGVEEFLADSVIFS